MIKNATRRTEDDDEKESVRQTKERGGRRKKRLGFRALARARACACRLSCGREPEHRGLQNRYLLS
jgi:hypothetical protein